jgi:hypothetical protein
MSAGAIRELNNLLVNLKPDEALTEDQAATLHNIIIKLNEEQKLALSNLNKFEEGYTLTIEDIRDLGTVKDELQKLQRSIAARLDLLGQVTGNGGQRLTEGAEEWLYSWREAYATDPETPGAPSLPSLPEDQRVRDSIVNYVLSIIAKKPAQLDERATLVLNRLCWSTEFIKYLWQQHASEEETVQSEARELGGNVSERMRLNKPVMQIATLLCFMYHEAIKEASESSVADSLFIETLTSLHTLGLEAEPGRNLPATMELFEQLWRGVEFSLFKGLGGEGSVLLPELELLMEGYGEYFGAGIANVSDAELARMREDIANLKSRMRDSRKVAKRLTESRRSQDPNVDIIVELRARGDRYRENINAMIIDGVPLELIVGAVTLEPFAYQSGGGAAAASSSPIDGDNGRPAKRQRIGSNSGAGQASPAMLLRGSPSMESSVPPPGCS